MIEDVHSRAGAVMGEISLAIVRRKASVATMRRWGEVLKDCGERLIEHAAKLSGGA